MELTSKNNNYYKIDKTDSYWIYDSNGNRQLDINCGSFAYTLGYGNSEIIDEISSSLGNITRAHLPLGQTTDDIEDMKNLLLTTGNWGGLIWSLTGTGAVEAGIQIAQAYFKKLGQNKNKVVTFGFGWHGTSNTTKKYSGMLPISENDNIITLSTPVWLNETERDIQENELLNDLTNLLTQDNEIGIILINPNPWFNGVNIWSAEFWYQLYLLKCEFNFLIVLDDVASCWGKAKAYHSHTTLLPNNIVPDISCVGKAITAGYAPLSAAVASEEISNIVSGNVSYSHTFQPYVGGIAAMKAVDRIIRRDNLFEKTNWIESELNRIGNKLIELEIITHSKVYGTCAAYYTENKEIGKKLKEIYYGVSSHMAKIPNVRICAPLIADAEYFHHLENMLKKI